MNHDTYSDAYLRDVLSPVRTIAVVGASPRPHRPSHGVMRYLQERPGKAVGRYDLMEAVWGYRNPTASNVVDVVVRSLRQKLGAEAASVETVRGTGYRYRVPNGSDRPKSR